ncbi:MAG: DUF2141 domain-containing protein [Caulobacter sp.]|nr:DUF2141 domain-containing protein [Caulobacter sp.]
MAGPAGGPVIRAGLLLAALLALSPVAAGARDEDGSLTMFFDGISRREGVVLVALFDSKAAYDANTGPVRTLTMPAAGGDFAVTLAGLAPGPYAVKAFHDRDANGRMNFNPLGMPLEPYGFSNNARAPFGPPPWRRAVFEVRPGGNAQAIRLR